MIVNERLSDRSRVCSCDQEPVHTVGWCEALRRSKLNTKTVYSSRTDPKLKTIRRTGDRSAR